MFEEWTGLHEETQVSELKQRCKTDGAYEVGCTPIHPHPSP